MKAVTRTEMLPRYKARRTPTGEVSNQSAHFKAAVLLLGCQRWHLQRCHDESCFSVSGVGFYTLPWIILIRAFCARHSSDQLTFCIIKIAGISSKCQSQFSREQGNNLKIFRSHPDLYWVKVALNSLVAWLYFVLSDLRIWTGFSQVY